MHIESAPHTPATPPLVFTYKATAGDKTVASDFDGNLWLREDGTWAKVKSLVGDVVGIFHIDNMWQVTTRDLTIYASDDGKEWVSDDDLSFLE